MVKTMSKYEEIFEKIRKNLGDDERFASTMEFIRKLTKNYSENLGIEEDKILEAFESKRNYWSANYYQEANFPFLESERVLVFDTLEDLFKKFPSRKFICPACKGISTNPYECNSGKDLDGKKCDWKVYGLFADLGKGIFLVIKDKFFEHPKPDLIFKPIEIVEKEAKGETNDKS